MYFANWSKKNYISDKNFQCSAFAVLIAVAGMHWLHALHYILMAKANIDKIHLAI